MPGDTATWLDIAKNGALLLVVIGFMTGKIVPDWVHKELQKRYEEERALNRELIAGTRDGTALADRSAQLTERILENIAAVRQRRPDADSDDAPRRATRSHRSDTER